MNKISKIIWCIFSSFMCIMYKSEAKAEAGDCTQVAWTSTSQNLGGLSYTVGSGCKSKSYMCYHLEGAATYCYETCNTCSAGYTQTYSNRISVLTSSCKNVSVTANDCVCKCSNCTDTGTWTAKGTGYEQITRKICSCSTGTATCSTKTTYRCAAGYYGTTSNGTSGCNKCPDLGTALGTSIAGATTISGCYIPGNTSYSDTTGKYAFNCDCPYNGKNSCDSGGNSSSSSSA